MTLLFNLYQRIFGSNNKTNKKSIIYFGEYHFSNLPLDVGAYIMSFLSVRDLYQVLQVSKHYYTICSSNMVFEQFCANLFVNYCFKNKARNGEDKDEETNYSTNNSNSNASNLYSLSPKSALPFSFSFRATTKALLPTQLFAPKDQKQQAQQEVALKRFLESLHKHREQFQLSFKQLYMYMKTVCSLLHCDNFASFLLKKWKMMNKRDCFTFWDAMIIHSAMQRNPHRTMHPCHSQQPMLQCSDSIMHPLQRICSLEVVPLGSSK